jgi:hypothetical protein
MATMLFFDDWPVQTRHNVRRVMGKPQWIPGATLEDALTEGTWNFPFVWHDAQDGKWKALYGGALPMGDVLPNPPITHVLRSQALMYAESEDGYHWTRPDVSARATHVERPYPGALNIVYSVKEAIDGAPVFYDPVDPEGTGKLKYLFTREGRQGLAASHDGIAWHDVPGVEIGNYKLDSPITAFYNHHRDSYCISRRLHCGDRRVALFETKDWRKITHTELIMHPDPMDPPMMQIYGMPIYRYANIYVGLLWRLHCHPTEELAGIKGHGGPIDCSLAYSLDGWHFHRATHKAFIPTNPRGEHGGGCVYVGCMVVDEENGLIRFYSGGSKAEHFVDQTLTDAALMLHTLRLDGFFRLESYVMRGTVMTRTLMFEQGTGPDGRVDLRLNARAPHGQVRVRITDPQGHAIEGFDWDDCVPLIGDDLFWRPLWRSGRTLDELAKDARYHIEVELISAELYAIRGDLQLHYGFGHEHAPSRYMM